uniref:Homeobox domain-containing protein n=1 Tax=Strigamia maritima TaxID=126957 RepID=T1IS95_STRMM
MQQAPAGSLPIVQQSSLAANTFNNSPTVIATTHSQDVSTINMAATQVITTANGAIQYTDAQTQAQFEADKRAVYRHPLFPLLALLFEKCELATQSAECPSSESFNVDIQAFVQHQEQDRKPFFSDDPEVDNLMVKAIQVLRIHLLELEKVQELCKDFCHRYITCLKGKMQSENLLRSDYPGYSSASPGSDSDSRQSNQSQPVHTPSVQQVVTSGSSVNNVVIQQSGVQSAVSMTTLQPGQIVSGGTVYQMVQTPQGIVAQPIQIQASTPVQSSVTAQHIIHGSTPLSQIGAATTAPPSTDSSLSIPADHLSAAPTTPSSQDEDDDVMGKKKQKRGILPKHATSIMRSWLFQHIVHPYPTEDEKRQIAAQTNLTLLQVNNWFINARRRILQPMLDASNPDASHKAKKAKTQSSRPLQRFWPDNIANLQPQVASATSETQNETISTTANTENAVITSTTDSGLSNLGMLSPQNGEANDENEASVSHDPQSASDLSLENSDSSSLGDD